MKCIPVTNTESFIKIENNMPNQHGSIPFSNPKIEMSSLCLAKSFKEPQ
jgi:hypothetical protein